MFAAQERRRAQAGADRTNPGRRAGRRRRRRSTASRCVAMSYDYTVLAGTQGMRNHLKKDRLFELAERRRLPVVLFAEGGGGRPGDVDMPIVAGLDCRAFRLFARLSGLVPLVGIASGYCFAGNAALLGCCDVVIATEDASIGMGGPAMIEGGGLGVLRARGGRADRRSSTPTAWSICGSPTTPRRSRWPSATWATSRGDADPRGPEPPDQRGCATSIPDQPQADLRRPDGDRRPVRRGLGARAAPRVRRRHGHRAGPHRRPPARAWSPTIPPTSAERSTPTAPTRRRGSCSCATRSACRCCSCATRPGFMVGPEAERTATVRHFSRMFVTGANLTVPTGTVVLRKGYGLGAQAMAGRRLQGAAVHGRLADRRSSARWDWRARCGSGMRRELEAIEDPGERERALQAAVAGAYERGQGISMASYFEIDDVIDPADTPPLGRHPVRRRALRRGGAPGQAAAEHRRLVAAPRPQSQRSQAPRSKTSWLSIRTPSRSESLSMARSSAASSNATRRPHRSQTRW